MIVVSPLRGTVVSIEVRAGDAVTAGQTLAILESMKMEHPVLTHRAGVVSEVQIAVGDTVVLDEVLFELAVGVAALEPEDPGADVSTEGPTQDAPAGDVAAEEAPKDLGARPDLAAVRSRRALTSDEARPDAVAKRHTAGRLTAREQIDALCAEGSFVEYGAFVVAAQRRRRGIDELITSTPADGLVCGIGRINDGRFGPRAGVAGAPETRAVVLAYDATVLAGTQGMQNHAKKDRMFDVALRLGLPVVFFTEGGGGRPGDVDAPGVSGLDVPAFRDYARLSGKVPLVAVVSGYCFAGNAALAGCSDVIIATGDTNLGMAGPAMIEGGGLGTFGPSEIGPADAQVRTGVIDVLVEDQSAAIRTAARYLSYFQGTTADWTAPDASLLRDAVPESRTRVYDVRALLAGVADVDSVLELRHGFGASMLTALIRIEGRPVGVIANDPVHLGGAIDADAADKAARFLQLCDAHGLAVLSLCDTPGMMVGPDAEAEALVRHCSRLFVTGANLTVPLVCVVTRKCYGLGAQAMAGGTLKEPLSCVAWPSGEFGGMGLEGAVRLGFRRELDAIVDEAERQAVFADMVERAYEHGAALNVASHFEIDDVIDPADTRRWITATLPPAGRGSQRYIDPW